MKFYNYIFKSPLLLAMIAIFVLSVTKVDIYGEIFIFLIISLIYTLKQEDIPNQWFKIKFALYYTLFYTIRNIIIVCLSVQDSFTAAYMLVNLPKLVIIFPLKSLIALISSYLNLFISNRIFYIILKFAQSLKVTRNFVAAFRFLLEKPHYLISLIAIIFVLNTFLICILNPLGISTFAGTIEKNGAEITSVIPLKNGNAVILQNHAYTIPNQISIYDSNKKEIKSDKIMLQEYEIRKNNPRGVLLDNGKILIFGDLMRPRGNIKTKTPDAVYAELYDPVSNSLAMSEKFPFNNSAFGLCKLKNGKILIAGGQGYSKTAVLYDPETNKFEQVADLNKGKISPAILPLDNGNAVVISYGSSLSDTISPDMEIYHTQSQTFTPVKINFQFKYSTFTHNTQAFDLGNNQIGILLYRDNTLNLSNHINEIPQILFVNLANNTYELKEIPELKNTIDFSVLQLNNNEIMIIGGQKWSARKRTFVYSKELGIYNVKKQKYRKIAGKMKIARTAAAAAVLNDNSILITGGNNEKNYIGIIKEAEHFIRFK